MAFIEEFRAAGFADASIIRTFSNARTRNSKVTACDLTASKPFAAN